MKACALFITAATLPIALACTLSLPLILLGLVRPDPHPWNWLSVYIVDLLFGLVLLAQVIGFARRALWSRPLTIAAGGYAVFAFGQVSLEIFLDLAGVQPAPVTNKFFILAFMIFGCAVGAAQIAFACKAPEYWKPQQGDDV